MRKVWTRVVMMVLVLVVAISFSACSLFTTDLDKKYSATSYVVTTAGDDGDNITVSRYELYQAYLQWGAQYANYFSTTEDLLEYLSTMLLNSKILEKFSLDKFGELREAEEALALRQAYQSLDQTLRAYIYEARGEKDESTTNEEESTETTTENTYSPYIIVGEEDGERVYTLNLSSYADKEGLGTLTKDTYRYYVPEVPGVVGDSPAAVRSAIAKIVRNLQALEKGFTKLKVPARDYLDPGNQYFKNLSQGERETLNREIDRMVNANRTSIYNDRINTAYALGLTELTGDEAKNAWTAYLNRSLDFEAWCDSINNSCGRDVAKNIAERAIEYYKGQVKDAINSDAAQDENLEKALTESGLNNVYFIPQNTANNLFTVSHILFKMTDEQSARYKDIEDNKDNPDREYEKEIKDLKSEVTSNGKSVETIYKELEAKLENASQQEKYDIFREYIATYNTDPGMERTISDELYDNQPQYEYLMSSNTDNNQMIPAFTAASIDLFDGGRGEKGAISELVWTEYDTTNHLYGAHIIMYTRKVSDIVFTDSVDSMESKTQAINNFERDYANALFTPLTSYGKRTLFDTLVDNYYVRDSASYRSAKIDDYKSNHEVSIVKSAFKDFLKK